MNNRRDSCFMVAMTRPSPSPGERERIPQATKLDERAFVSHVLQLVAEIAARRPDLPFIAGAAETHAAAGGRHDLKILDRFDQTVVALTGEVKMPHTAEGQSPYSHQLLNDAFLKANQCSPPPRFFITWNVLRLVLWNREDERKPIHQRDCLSWRYTGPIEATPAGDPTPAMRLALTKFLERVLGDLAPLHGDPKARVPARAVDERIIDILHGALESPIYHMEEALRGRAQQDRAFRTTLEQWLLDKLEIEPGEGAWRLAAQQVCFVFLLKLVFYGMLWRRFPDMSFLPLLEKHRTTARVLRQDLVHRFEDAKEVSGDYETVLDLGDEFTAALPFLTEALAAGWIEVIDILESFDLSRIDNDILGPLWERLMDPAERHQYGQHFTKPAAVDLINAFCIREPRAKVMDPACGGGTFLVRAYERKLALAAQAANGKPLSHDELLDDLYGVDINDFPALVSTINLAVRDVVQGQNYPKVARRDFFAVLPHEGFFARPRARLEFQNSQRKVSAVALGKNNGGELIPIPDLDAIVGNPPYVRQERIGEENKDRIRALVAQEFGEFAPFSERSDLYVYFWAHGTTFLRDGGRFGFLTSAQWLESDYGFKLQQFFLRHYAIEAIIAGAPKDYWFSVARVRPIITILRRESDPLVRAETQVRFVLFKQPLENFIPGGDVKKSVLWADELRDKILRTKTDATTERFRLRIRKQIDLLKDGIPPLARELLDHEYSKIGAHRQKASQENTDAKNAVEAAAKLYGGAKWGIPLRAPEVFFEIVDRAGNRLRPLGEMAEVRFGIKTGADEFFFVHDVTDAVDEGALWKYWHLKRRQVKEIRIIEGVGGERFLIEAEYLAPIVFNLMEIDRAVVTPEICRRRVLLVDRCKPALKGTLVLKYIERGESADYRFHERPTCAARLTGGRDWFMLLPGESGAIMWSMTHQYRHIAAQNPAHLHVNHRLFDITPMGRRSNDVVAGILNSSIQDLFKRAFGRTRHEGALETEVIDVKMMLALDPKAISADSRREITRAFAILAKRRLGKMVAVTKPKPGEPPQEIGQADRRALDLAVIKALGFSPREAESMVERLYEHLTQLYRSEREGENVMVKSRQGVASAQRASPLVLAREIWENNLAPGSLKWFPKDFVPPGVKKTAIHLAAGELPFSGRHSFYPPDLADPRGKLVVNGEPVPLPHGATGQFLVAAGKEGLSGDIEVPLDPDECRQAVQAFEQYLAELGRIFQHCAESRSANLKRQAKIVESLWGRYRSR